MLDDLPYWPGHTIAVGTIIAAISHLLPPAATLASLAYFILQIYRDETVQNWLQEYADRSRATCLILRC
jgi:hypothetical protein